MEFSGDNNDSSQNNSGLLRYRSAPTSLLSNLTSLDDQTNSVDVVMENDIDGDDGDNSCHKGFASMIMNSQLPPQYPRPNVGSNRLVSSIGILDNYEGQGIKNMASNLVKQNSSPAGFFSHLNSLNGYAGARLVGNYRVSDDGGANGDISTSSSRLRNHMGFGMLSRITEVEHENGLLHGHDEPKVENISVDNLFSTFGSWNNDSSYYAENFASGVKREMVDNQTLFVNSQDVEMGNMSHILSRHFSLPKASSAEIGAMEKLLHFQDTVPCKIRAKRGCATHPRSIAERVRRTRISERMRKLQELVPNMDKQTNTSDMLDFAVEYIKGLQKQYKTLRDIRANCKCSASEKMYLNEAH